MPVATFQAVGAATAARIALLHACPSSTSVLAMASHSPCAFCSLLRPWLRLHACADEGGPSHVSRAGHNPLTDDGLYFDLYALQKRSDSGSVSLIPAPKYASLLT
jgi:hypothetical protein